MLLLVLLGAAVLFRQHLTCQASYRNDTTIHVNSFVLSAEDAKTPRQLSQGLGGRACIGPSQAMLFKFNKSGVYPTWMKGMRFAIDIIWIDSQHKVVNRQLEVSPSTYPNIFTNTKPAQYVLEMQAGRANQIGLTRGTTVQF